MEAYLDLLRNRLDYGTGPIDSDLFLTINHLAERLETVEARLNNSSSCAQSAQSAQAYKVTIKDDRTNGHVTIGGPCTKGMATEIAKSVNAALDFTLRAIELDAYEVVVEEVES